MKRMTNERLAELEAGVAKAKKEADDTRAKYFPDHYDPYDWDYCGFYATELDDAYPELLDALKTERAISEWLAEEITGYDYRDCFPSGCTPLYALRPWLAAAEEAVREKDA